MTTHPISTDPQTRATSPTRPCPAAVATRPAGGDQLLTLTKLADAEYLIAQVAQGIDEYYTGGGEAPGVWHGRWAAQLGLEGIVEDDGLRVLLDGHHPTEGGDLLAGRPQ